jgi:hypothetical protein
MLSKLRPHLTYANVVSTACLFVVLGGTSYAVATGSIDSREIKNGTISRKDLSKKLRAQLAKAGVPGPPGAKGDTGAAGAPGLSLFTFADTGNEPGIALSGADTVVTSTAEQLPGANGAVGGSVTLPAGPGTRAATSTIRVRTQGSGAYACALQSSVNGTAFFDEDRTASTSENVLRFSVPTVGFLSNTPVVFQYRVVCSGAATRSVTDTDLSVIVAVRKQ